MDGSQVTPPKVSRIFFNSPEDGETYELGETISGGGRVRPRGNGEWQSTGGTDDRQPNQAGNLFGLPLLAAADASWRLNFEYEVEASDRDPDGISITANALSLNGGSIKASADGTTDADLTHAAVAADADAEGGREPSDAA